uniref:Coiled-coil domain-containing protein 5 n=1 Tax=Lepeophtheirus salmonis TaxID=72036 RepID=C1BVF0_LEPSM|nr:Coiled-coil domain-containing protein 5 [Lepeophtheirus salmonis]
MEDSSEVRSWLKELFSAEGEKIPSYELTQDSMSVLNDTRLWNRARDSEINAQMSCHEKQIQEYIKETERMNTVLEPLGLGSASGSMGKKGNILVNMALELGIDDPDVDSIDLALSKLKSQRLMDSLNNLENPVLSNTKTSKKVQNLLLLGDAESAVLKLKSEPPLKFSSQSKQNFLHKKQEGYSKDAHRYRQTYFNNIQSEDHIHSNIVQIKAETRDLNSDVDKLQKKLSSYNELPPSLELAETKVKELSNQLRELDDILTQSLSRIH